MKNKKTIITASVAAVLVGGALIAGPALSNKFSKEDMDGDHSSMSMTSENADGSFIQKDSSDYRTYSELKGENYDRMFLANMIVHHEGAVEMAELALKNAKHQELKDLANDIISAQNDEIGQMKSWQQNWGYPSSSGESMMDHSAMGMMDDMAGMTNDLKGKTGDDFDKAFISGMIMHHQGAINMAAPGATNAEHQEVKDLTKAIISAQTKEIKQMKSWQQDWGY